MRQSWTDERLDDFRGEVNRLRGHHLDRWQLAGLGGLVALVAAHY